uniref:Dual oxidase maturation factor 1 n=1 Tax=Leptobrachium leishanense TaxID=445787 RepID=A0A8C5M4X4_9ANUR
MAFYDGIFPFYSSEKLPFVLDMDAIIIIYVFLVFGLAFLLVVLGIRGKARIFWSLRVLISLFIGAVTVGVNFTGDWEVGLVNATTTYKSFSNSVVEADIGLNVGLQRINITLKGNPVHQINQTINYNEQFLWNFGEDANDYYNEGLKSGLPNPILYISEKFFQHNPCALYTQYRLYGHYASACMWVAFCSWIICNILFSMSVFIYGAYMILVTASFFIFSLLSFYTIKYVPLCDIKFGAESMTPTTEDHFGSLL